MLCTSVQSQGSQTVKWCNFRHQTWPRSRMQPRMCASRCLCPHRPVCICHACVADTMEATDGKCKRAFRVDGMNFSFIMTLFRRQGHFLEVTKALNGVYGEWNPWGLPPCTQWHLEFGATGQQEWRHLCFKDNNRFRQWSEIGNACMYTHVCSCVEACLKTCVEYRAQRSVQPCSRRSTLHLNGYFGSSPISCGSISV